MSKSRLLQIMAVILLLMGTYISFSILNSGRPRVSMLSGIGPIIMGIALLIISFSKAIRKNDQIEL